MGWHLGPDVGDHCSILFLKKHLMILKKLQTAKGIYSKEENSYHYIDRPMLNGHPLYTFVSLTVVNKLKSL